MLRPPGLRGLPFRGGLLTVLGELPFAQPFADQLVSRQIGEQSLDPHLVGTAVLHLPIEHERQLGERGLWILGDQLEQFDSVSVVGLGDVFLGGLGQMAGDNCRQESPFWSFKS